MTYLRLALLLSIASAVGCQSDPFCLDCSDQDLSPIRLDLSEPVDQAMQPDLSGQDLAKPPDLSQCVATNGGVEICDGIDNDCNGTIDDVDMSKLQHDPQNCGMCGKKCNFLAQHQYGDCVPDTNNVPTCVPKDCLPGYVDLDPNTPGCEYQCVPTNGGVEICDGQDNNCDGRVDEGFAVKNASGTLIYATDASNCGACGTMCGLPGANTACQAVGPGGQGACVVTSCVNNPGNETFRHNPANGDINTVGCEYRCPVAATAAGDCNAMSCTFPAETCNGLDDDCNFVIDDNPTDVGAAVPCYDTCPGGTAAGCTATTQCKPGTLTCQNGAPTCTGGVGPSAEICDGKDNNCDGQIDELFGYPLYNTDPNNCGGCFNANDSATAVFSCTQGAPYANWHAVKGCHTDASVQPQGNQNGVCYVVACDENTTSGFRHRALQPSGNACVATTTKRDGPTGTGCDYACPSWPLKNEVCNGGDDNCNGCTDESLTPPQICSALGACNTNALCSGPCVNGMCPTIAGGTQACGGSRFTPVCQGAGGWVCDYRNDPQGFVEADAASGALAGAETKCDQRDNNCNNVVDTDGYSLISYTNPVSCTDSQLGECRRSGHYVCNAGGNDAQCLLTSPVVNAASETCDGKDNDCDGSTDETKASPGTNPSYVIEEMVQLTRPNPADAATPFTYYMNKYEASRPDATSSSVGVSTARACGKPGVIPWGTITKPDADAACAAAGMRLCSEAEWVRGCAGAAGNQFPYGATYDGSKCNGRDWNPTCALPDNFEQVQPTATPYGCPSLPASTQCVSAEGLIDLSGNVKEWTSTLASNGTSYVVHGGAYDNVEEGLTCSFDFVSLPPTTKLDTIGFRCCSDVAP